MDKSNHVYIITIFAAAGEEKKYAKELKYLFDHIQVYRPKRR